MQSESPAPRSIFGELVQSFRSSIGVKVLVIAMLIVALLMPLTMIIGLVEERQARQQSAYSEISEKWADAQTVVGPIISIPYRSYRVDKNEVRTEEKAYFHILPDELSIQTSVQPEKRYRGIYEVAVYRSELQLEGSFSNLMSIDPNISPSDILYDQAFISLGVSDLRGIENDVMLKWNDSTLSFNPGVESNDIVHNGIQAMLRIDRKAAAEKELKFSCRLKLRGSRDLNFVPIAKRTHVEMKSSWTDPSFIGAFLPDEREINASGCSATWTVLNVNRNYPQRWAGNRYELNNSAFGMSLLTTVDNYSKTERAVKYSILLVGLTFLVYLFLELRHKVRVHMLQYLLVGLALCIFYILLLSMTEHINFNAAYAIASVMTIAIISWYSNSVLGKRHLALMVAACLTLLYSLLFTILQLQDYALLAGSLALFVILAVIMHYSRGIDLQATADSKSVTADSEA